MSTNNLVGPRIGPGSASGGTPTPPPTPIVDPTFSLTGSTWPNANARALFPPSNLYPAIDEVGVISDGATSLTVITRIVMPAADTNLVDDMTIWARRLDGFDYHAQLVLMADRSLRAGVSGTATTWLQIDTAAGTLELGQSYVIALVYDGAGATAQTTLRMYITDGVGEVTQASPTYSGATSVPTLSTPLFCGWTIGAVYTSDTTSVRGLRDVTVMDVTFWTGLAAEGYALVRAMYAEDPVDFLGVFTEQLVVSGTGATSVNFGGTALMVGAALTASAATVYDGFYRYPASFISTLDEPGRSVLQDPSAAGTVPFLTVPGDGTFITTGMTLTSLAPSDETPTPNAFVLVSGTAVNQPAGLFGDTLGDVLSSPAGYVLHTIASVDVNTLGTRGTIVAVARAFGPTFEPSGLEGLGYIFDSNSPVVNGWVRMVGTVLTPLGATAPRDGREYGVLIVVSSATPATAYMALFDRSDRTAPVLLDEGTYTNPFAADADAWAEANASATATGTPGPVRRNTIKVVDGSLGYT